MVLVETCNPSEWKAIESISKKLKINPETLPQ
jgi:hypothetical protein